MKVRFGLASAFNVVTLDLAEAICEEGDHVVEPSSLPKRGVKTEKRRTTTMTRSYFLSTALTIMLGVGTISLAAATESGQPALTKKTLVAAIATAETPQDHQRIASYYKAEAGRMLAEAKEHDELAVAYAKSPNTSTKHPMAGQTADHCKYFAEAARKAAQASQELAKLHEDMAKPSK